MTDNEIIKALECCQQTRCMECPLRKKEHNCINKLYKYALDLINRQKAEIESLTNKYNLAVSEREANMCGFLEELNRYETERKELRAEIEELQAEIDKQYEQAKADILGNMSDGGTSCHWCIEQHKAEAVKEFAERVKKEMSFGRYIQYDQIDNLVKEMVGEG